MPAPGRVRQPGRCLADGYPAGLHDHFPPFGLPIRAPT